MVSAAAGLSLAVWLSVAGFGVPSDGPLQVAANPVTLHP
jgi:hypothetical protein